VAISPDDKVVATGSRDHTIKLWDADTGMEMEDMRCEEGWTVALAFSPNGKLLANGTTNAAVYLWDLETGQCVLLERQSTPTWALAFSPDGKRLAAGGSNDRTAKLWDVAGRTAVTTLKPDAAGGVIQVDGFTDSSMPSPKITYEDSRKLTVPCVFAGVLFLGILAVAVWLRMHQRG
jgi:WD40 repeat protein